jgi:hypothetical protein
MQSYDTMTDVVICHGVERRRRSHPILRQTKAEYETL